MLLYSSVNPIMSNISILSKEKNRSQELLCKVFASYLEKYMRKLYTSIARSQDKEETKSELREFQKCLSEIAKWEEHKQKREYKKFLKWVMKRYDLTELDLQSYLEKVITFSVMIVLHKYNQKAVLEKIKYKSTNPQDLFYKAIKAVARLYYESPNKVKEDSRDPTINTIDSIIYNFIPLNKVFEMMEECDGTEDSVKSYKYSKNDSSESEPKEVAVVLEKSSGSQREYGGKLEYVPSEEIYNEYYQSDNENKVTMNNKVSLDRKEKTEEEKVIEFPVRNALQKRTIVRNNPKKQTEKKAFEGNNSTKESVEENFFTE